MSAIQKLLNNSWQGIQKLRPSAQGKLRPSAQGTTKKFQPALSSLDERIVPSTSPTELNLTTLNSSGTINGAIFAQGEVHPAGNGVLNPFVRIDGKGTTEQGYNTDGRPLQFDEKNSANFTRSLKLSNVPQVQINGVTYDEFVLDIDPSTSSPLLSIDAVRIYLEPTGNLLSYNTKTNQLGGLSPVYDMGNNFVMLNGALERGHGKSDMFLDVPASDFTGSNQYVYLYSRFGVETGLSGGYVDWAVHAGSGGGGGGSGGSGGSGGTTTSLSGTVFYDSNNNGVLTPGDSGLPAMTVTLTGTDVNGNIVTQIVFSDANGGYSFTNLAAGTYSVTVTPTSAYINGPATDGTVNGIADGLAQVGYISGIVLQAGNQGTNYNFAEEILT